MSVRRIGPILGVMISLILGVAAIGCADPDEGDLIEIDLTAEVVDWQVVDGETVEVWGYNGEYPGPMIEARVGDTLRVNLTNNLPEGTTIHWHGIEVPNEQDGVPGITQPIIEPGASWTYEFKLEKAGTAMYHTHANTVQQLARGLVGPLVVRERGRAGDSYDREYTMVLHEIGGLFTINGHAFPATLADDDTFMKIAMGEKIRVRFINAGQQHHPMHLHGPSSRWSRSTGTTSRTRTSRTRWTWLRARPSTWKWWVTTPVRGPSTATSSTTSPTEGHTPAAC